MSDYTPKTGDRVRVVLEGPVREARRNGFFVGEEGGRDNYIVPAESHVVSVEKLPDPEPEWQPGDVVRDRTNLLWHVVYDGAIRWRPLGYSLRADYPDPDNLYGTRGARPLTLLVRDGKVVQ